jgi:hypothetical protein
MSDSSFQQIAEAIIAVFNAEFAAEQITMIPDRLHESLGLERVDVGISPLEDYPNSGNAIMQETWVEIRFYDIWKKEISPNTQMNPYRITAFAERLKNALRVPAATPRTGQVWYFDVRRTQYPPDPTGNSTRFHMTIRAFGDNPALIETTA